MLVCHVVCLYCVMEQQDVAISQQVPLSHTIRELPKPDLLSFHLCLCVYEKCVCMSVHESIRSVSSHLYSTSNTHYIRASILLSLSSFFFSSFHHCHLSHTLLHTLFSLLYPFIFQSSSMSFTRSLSSRHLLPTSSPFLFSCHPPCSPPSLTPQLGSTMRWQWQGCCVCVWLCLCVCLSV